jgi:hypothetical protein
VIATWLRPEPLVLVTLGLGLRNNSQAAIVAAVATTAMNRKPIERPKSWNTTPVTLVLSEARNPYRGADDALRKIEPTGAGGVG